MPTDYYPVLIRAVSALESNTHTARRGVYNRARVAIMDAGLPAEQIQAERSQLETAIARLEHELGGAGAPSSARSAPRPVRALDTADMGATAPEPETRATARPWLLAGAGIILIAAVGYALWPRSAPPVARAPEPASNQAAQTSLAAGRSTDGTADSGVSYVYRRQVVYYRTVHPPGTIVINKAQRNLYLVRPNVSAVRYTIRIGSGCTNAVGLLAVSDKPDGAPRLSAGATQSTGSARDKADGHLSLALGDTGHRIEGAEPPLKDGSPGCFIVTEEDMADLHERVSAGARVVIN